MADDIILAEPAEAPRYLEAVGFLERALASGRSEPEISYLLALANKRLGKNGPAREALKTIKHPDASVFLQMGILALREGQLAQAETEFARGFALDPQSYPSVYNLMMTRLTLGKLEGCRELLPQAQALATSQEEKRFLDILRALLDATQANRSSDAALDPILADMQSTEELRLLSLLSSLGDLDVSQGLLRTLSAALPESPLVLEAYAEVVMVKARTLMDRGDWLAAERLLQPLTRFRHLPRAHHALLLNLLGICTCFNQDFEAAIKHLNQALKQSSNDPRLTQNLALVHEIQGQQPQADLNWNRYFDLLQAGADLPCPPGREDYYEQLAYEGLMRLANKHSEKEKWPQALAFLQRAQRIRPRDSETLERLFHLHNHVKRTDDARKVLKQLREIKPGEPTYELYELDLNEVRNLSDVADMLHDLENVLRRHPSNPRVEERGIGMVLNLLPLLGELYNRLSERLSDIVDQVRSLPNYQINWSEVSAEVRDLMRDYNKLRKAVIRAIPILIQEEHRKLFEELSDRIGRKIDTCKQLLR